MSGKQRRAAVHAAFAKALLHHQAGRLSEAEALYRSVLADDARHADSLHLLGVLASQTQRHELAIKLIGKAIEIDPRRAPYHSNLGNTLKEQGHPDKAVVCYRRAIELKPDFPGAHSNLGNALRALGHLDEAVACYRKAIALEPVFTEAHSHLGIALRELGHLDEAVACCRRAIELKPDFPDAHSNLGSALRELGHLDEAVACYRRAIALKPDFPDALSNLGIALKEQGRLDEAVACCRRAIDLKPDYPQAHHNLGFVLQEQGHLDDAVACYRRATEIKPDFPDAHNNLAMALLMRGEMVEGWEEYEWRWKMPQMIRDRRTFAQPRWRGEGAEGQTLLIHAEQGLGDTLQFCRYATLAATRGLRAIIEVPKPLVRLLRSLSGVDHVVAHGEELPPFDLHCPMLSLPLALGTTLATIPSAASYLHASAVPVAAWRTRLAAMPNQGPRIGLVWAGSANFRANGRRSIALARLAPLFGTPGLNFFSLQKGGPAAREDFPLTDFMDEMEDFADTAALIANLDLVVAVDTAVAHLAAALGKPVWMLDRFASDWRWLAGRRDSPWYPTLRIYRQPQPGAWDAVLAEVVRDLTTLTV